MRLHSLERLFRRHGLRLHHVTGSHRVYVDDRGRRVVAAFHPGRELGRGEVAAIKHDLEQLRQREESAR